MAHHANAKKAIRQIERRTAVNRNRLTRIRTFLKKVEDAIEKKDKKAANDAFRAAQPELMRGVNKNIFKLNTAARKLSRLSKRIKAL